MIYLHSLFKPLAGHETPCQHSKTPRHCDTRKYDRSGECVVLLVLLRLPTSIKLLTG